MALTRRAKSSVPLRYTLLLAAGYAKPLRQMETATIVLLEGLGTLAVLVAQMCG